MLIKDIFTRDTEQVPSKSGVRFQAFFERFLKHTELLNRPNSKHVASREQTCAPLSSSALQWEGGFRSDEIAACDLSHFLLKNFCKKKFFHICKFSE